MATPLRTAATPDADTSEKTYRREWSSNNYVAALFLDYKGHIDYDRLLAHANTVPDIDLTLPISAYDIGLWDQIRQNRYDMFLMTLRDKLAKEIDLFRKTGPTVKSTLKQLARILRLRDLFAVHHATLQSKFEALCGLVPNNVCDLFRHAKLGVVNYEFWVRLYNKYIKPRVEGLRNTICPDDAIHWQSVWFTTAVWSDDIKLFEQTCKKLGYERQEIIELISTGRGTELGLNVSILCQADALDIIRGLELWTRITAADLAESIIPMAGRLHAALREEGRTFTISDISRLHLRGLRGDILPFLPPGVTPMLIIKTVSPTAGMFFALMKRYERPLTWDEIYQLFANNKISSENLIRYVLPVERVIEGSFGRQVRYLEQKWGVDRENSYDYPHLYRLFLLYWIEQGRSSLTPFRMYQSDNLGNNVAVRDDRTETDQVRGNPDPGRCNLTFASRSYARILSLYPDDRVEFGKTKVYHTKLRSFVYIPRKKEITIDNLDENEIFGLYDCDIRGFGWFCTKYAELYPGEEVSDSE